MYVLLNYQSIKYLPNMNCYFLLSHSYPSQEIILIIKQKK